MADYVYPFPQTGITEYGMISIQLDDFSIKLTVDGGLHLVEFQNNIELGLSKNGEMVAAKHPYGELYAWPKKVEIRANHPTGKRYSKISSGRIAFTSEDRPTTYFLDAGGVKTGATWFVMADNETIRKMSYADSLFGEGFIEEATRQLNKSMYWSNDGEKKMFKINDIEIIEGPRSKIQIFKMNKKIKAELDARFGKLKIVTPEFHSTFSLKESTGKGGHMFVRRNNSRLHYNGLDFIIRHEGQSARLRNNNTIGLF